MTFEFRPGLVGIGESISFEDGGREEAGPLYCGEGLVDYHCLGVCWLVTFGEDKAFLRRSMKDSMWFLVTISYTCSPCWSSLAPHK